MDSYLSMCARETPDPPTIQKRDSARNSLYSTGYLNEQTLNGTCNGGRLTETAMDSSAQTHVPEVPRRLMRGNYEKQTFGPLQNGDIKHENSCSGSKEASARRRLETFSSNYMAEALERLGITSERDIEVILPATSIQSQMALSFAMDRRNYMTHSVLTLKPDVQAEALKRAVEMVISEQAIYRCTIHPCDDALSPFAQVILTPEAWRRIANKAPRIVHRRASPNRIAGPSKVWLDLAEENINLDSHRLYHIQVIEPDSNSESDFSGSGLLVISIVHCLCDAASLEVLTTDIARRYAGLEPLSRQGIDEAVLQWASNLDPEIDQWWQESMKGWETENLSGLSGNNIEQSANSTGYDQNMVYYSGDLPWQVLEEKSRTLGASPLIILQASWSLLLQAFSEADTGEITFGSVISSHQSSAHAPRCSVMPCRLPLPANQTVRQLLDSLTKRSSFAQSHRHTSFGIFKTLPYNTALAVHSYIPSDSDTGHDLSEPTPVPWTEVRNEAIRHDFPIFIEVYPSDPRFPTRNRHCNSITFKLTYHKDVLSEMSATCIAKQLAALTEIMLDSLPHEMVQWLPSQLPRSLLSAEGTVPVQDQQTKAGGEEQTPDRSRLLHSQFEDQAASTPDLLALSFYTSLDSPPINVTYGELDARANGLAEILREEDVEIIPVCMERNVELYVAVLAILKAGSAWCPIDDTSPVQRRSSLIARTQSKLLLTTTESLPLVDPCLAHESLAGLRVICIDHYASKKKSVKPSPRRGVVSSPHVSGQDLSYLLWTSGTTGEPKGVMIQHSAATQAMRDLQIQVGHDDQVEQIRTLQFSSCSFDVFVQDLFYTWGLAGSVISATREIVLNMFTEFIWKAKITHAHLTPSFGASVDVEEIRGSTLQYVTFIGEKLTEDVAEAWATPGITACAYNTYGPAENAVVSTMRQFYGKSRDQAKAASVGFPLHHCTSYVVREVELPQEEQKRWELVPRYGVGELALGGAQVGKGYLRNEAKTTKAFIQGGSGIDGRIYLTGDMVRLNDHGFEFLGRNDDLVKITGIRIELSEISAACATIKDEELAVEHVETLFNLRPDAEPSSNNKVVVTFVSVKKGKADTGKIRTRIFERARDMLPSYMVPGHVVVLETTMPRTASNKIDRKALQEIYRSSDLNILAGRDHSKEINGDRQPMKSQWNEDQLSLLQIIANNFKVDIDLLSPEDSLAALGFSSLLVVKLAWTLRRQLDCTVGSVDLMRCQLLGELVAVILSKLPGAKNTWPPKTNGILSPEEPLENPEIASIKEMLTKKLGGTMRPHDTLYVLPATPMQESLIVETMLEPGAYWIHRVFDLSHLGQIDSHRLKEAWTTAARRFDILRTIFVSLSQLDIERTEGYNNSVTWARQQSIQSTIVQMVRADPVVRWNLISTNKGQDLASVAKKIQVDLAPTTTDQPPWSITLAEGDCMMMLSIHHALYDLVSSQILLDTVSILYQKQHGDGGESVIQLERGMELGLLATPSQRSDAASLWATRLEDLRKTSGALNAPFPHLTQSRQKQAQKILLSKKAIPSSWFTSSSGTPPLQTLIQSAFGCILASYLELKAVVFGQTVSQRILHPRLANVMGPAIATLPVVVRADAPSAEELWREMARDSSNLFRSTHNLHPVDIKKLLNQGSGNTKASFPGLFVYHPAPESAQGMENNAAARMFRELDLALSLYVEHPLALNVFEAEEFIELTGDARRISQAQLELMLDQIMDQARLMLESPKLPLDRLQNGMSCNLVSISGEVAVDQNLSVDPTDSVSIHASEHPEWIAAEEVMFREPDEDEDELVTKCITYAQLDKLTNAIASKLASHEVHLQPDDYIAMYMGRDIKSLATTLAIFRAGYVYLPVDEDLPLARKRLLVRDAKAKLIITTEKLIENLELNFDSDPSVLLMPDGDDDIDVMLSWSVLQTQRETGHGGYLLYTSGSTGRPKGVRVSNSNLCHFVSSFSNRLIESSPTTASLGGVGKYLSSTSRAFDPHITQLFVPWYLGYRVVIGNDRTAVLGSMQQVINKLSITHFGSVPTVLDQMKLRPEDVPSVRVVTTGGEKASNELLDTWSKRDDSADRDGPQKEQQAVLINFYGPTEVTIGCLGHAVNRDSTTRNLGLPFQGLEALLLCQDTGDEQVIARRGQPGELCITGPQVAMGYLDRPLENAKSFQTTSLFGGSDRRMYRTGDIMRMMQDGTLEFQGRADQQAKIRGQRLELDEVVSFLKEAAADEDDLDFAATVYSNGDGHSNQQQQLLGFVAYTTKNPFKGEVDAEAELLQSQSTSLLERIEKKCEAELPAFMVPTMVWVSKIPYLKASGKVDTKLLAKLASDFVASQEDHQGLDGCASSGSVLDARESVVIAAVEEAVGSKVNATATSRLHRLGIDSLSAVHLVSLLRAQAFAQLKIADLLSPSCTVSSIARSTDQDLNDALMPSRTSSTTPGHQQSPDRPQEVKTFTTADLGAIPVGLDITQIEAVLPCLPLQAALVACSLVWLTTSSAGNENSDAVDVPYVAQYHYRLAHGTDVVRWMKAAELVVISEAMLNTCFIQREEDGRIFQVVLRSTLFSPFDGQDGPADVVAQMNVRPPIRLHIGKADTSGQTIVSLKIHHALFDGVAIDVLRGRLERAYNGQASITASPDHSLDVLRSISTHCQLSDAQVETTRRFWQARLKGVRPCHVGTPNDSNNKHDAMARSVLRLAHTTSQLKAKLQAQSQESGMSISLASTFQMATTLCVAHLTQRTSVVYGFVISLRPLLDHVADGVNEFVGPCLNTVVQAHNLRKGNETLSELAQRVHEAHIGSCQSNMPLVSVDRVQRWAGSEDKLFNSLLSINVVPANVTSNGQPKPGSMTALQTRSKSDMALAIDVDLHADGQIVLTLSSAGALRVSQLEDVGRLFEKAICSAADPNAKVEQLLPNHHDMSVVLTNGYHASNGLRAEPEVEDEEYVEAFACVRKLVCRLLRLEATNIPDKTKITSLYQLGLDSISVLPFVKLINKAENIKLTPNAVIKARTIQGAAKLVQEAKSKTRVNAIGDYNGQDSKVRHEKAIDGMKDEQGYNSTLIRLAKDFMFIATPLQEGMLSASMAIAGKAYTYTHAMQLSEYAVGADTASLGNFFAAIKDTVQACEILRTCFIFTHDDEAPWVGIVSPTEQSNLINWEVLQSVKPVRVELRIHHALYDATSIQAVWRILGENYQRRLHGHDNEDNEAAEYLFRPFARTAALAQRASVAFWSNLIQNYSYTSINFPNDTLHASSAFHFTLSEQELALLRTRCQALNVTIKAALQLAWVKVLCESLYGQADIVFGEVVSTGGGLEGDHDGEIIGPTINTVPMRIQLAGQEMAVDLADALSRVQKLNDDVRGSVTMASLRKIQTSWRLLSRDHEAMPASLFQSLFVFDGVIASKETDSKKSEQLLLEPAQIQTPGGGGGSDNGPGFDDFQVIVSFCIKNNILQGKLRAKMTQEDVEILGSKLKKSVRSVVYDELQRPVIDVSHMETVRKKNSARSGRAINGIGDDVEKENLTSTADAVLGVVKKVLGARSGDKVIGHHTRLVNVGLDSILAIRLSKLLKRKLGISASVFEIVKGASIHDIVKTTITSRNVVAREQRRPLVDQDTKLKDLVAKKLGLQRHLVKSILPVLSGQRMHLEQWLHNGKRFLEPPWVYRVVDDSVGAQKVANCWAQLCRIHDALRTTFVWTGSATGLVQVTLAEEWVEERHFADIRDSWKPIQILIEEHVSEQNKKPSDFRRPPARLSFLEAPNGKAVALRLHHALYDAWSIKRIEEDLNVLLGSGKLLQTRPSLENTVCQINAIRQPNFEKSYWKQHLLHAQDTVLEPATQSDVLQGFTDRSPHGSNFKASYPVDLPRSTVDILSQTNSNTRTSTAIILAYAKTLGHFIKRSRPTFGLYHTSRSLSSADGSQTLDLSTASVPTLTLTPFSVDLDSQTRGESSEDQLAFIRDHLAQLYKFAQSEDLETLSPQFNSYINILYLEDIATEDEDADGPSAHKVLSRYRLPEPLASEYFTTSIPSPHAISTIEELQTSHLCPYQVFFNIVVRPNQDIRVTVAGNTELYSGHLNIVTRLVEYFNSQLITIIEFVCRN